MESTRITAPIVKKVLDDHLHEHVLKLDPKQHDVYHAVFGQQGKGGLCDDVENIKTKYEARLKTIDENIADIKDTLKWVARLVIGAVIAAGLGLVFIP